MSDTFDKYLVKDAIDVIKKVFLEQAINLTRLRDVKFISADYSKQYKTLSELNAYGSIISIKLDGIMGFHCTRKFVDSCLDAMGLISEDSSEYEDMQMNLPSVLIDKFVTKASPLFVELGYNIKYKSMNAIFGAGFDASKNKELVSASLKFSLEGHEVIISFCFYIPELENFDIIQNEYYVVPAFSIAESDKVPFDVFIYLRTNNKLLKIFSNNVAIDPEFKQKILKQKHDLLYIKKDNIETYQEYIKEDIIRKMQDIKKLSDNTTKVAIETYTAVIADFQTTVTGLFKTLIKNPDVGKSLVDQCSTLIKDSIATLCNEKDFFKKINSIVVKFGTENSHYVNVSTFAIMFAIALEVNDPVTLKELGMAATFHDIGKIKFPEEMKNKNIHVMNEQEIAIYKQHPQFSVDMLKSSNAKLSNMAFRLIIEHHENVRGTGFPNNLKETQIHPYSQILGIADRFENLICGFNKNKGLTPQEAIQKMLDDNSVPETKLFNQEILQSLFNKLMGQ